MPRLDPAAADIGIAISKRQVSALLNEGQDGLPRRGRAGAAGRAGDRRAGSASTTPAPATSTATASAPRSATTTSPRSPPPRLEEPAELPRAVLRAGYRRLRRSTPRRSPTCASAPWPGPVIARLAAHPERHFADEAAWARTSRRLGITALTVTPDPVRIATEGALWGSIKAPRPAARHRDPLPTTPASSRSTGTPCAGSMPSAWCTSSTPSPTGSTPPRRRARPDLVVLRRPQGLPPRPGAGDAAASCARGSTGSSDPHRVRHPRPAARAAARQQGRAAGGARPARRCRCTPTAPRATCAPRSTGARSPAAPARDAGRDCRDAFLGLLMTCAKLGIRFQLGARPPPSPSLPTPRPAPGSWARAPRGGGGRKSAASSSTSRAPRSPESPASDSSAARTAPGARACRRR